MINRDSLLSFDWSVFKISNITTENITYFHNNNLIISLILSWVVKIKKGSKNLIDSLDIFAFVDEEFKYIGKSMAKGRYYVNYHTKIKDLSELKLYLQIVLRSGMRRPIHQCPYTTIYFD
ncbi:hypothetical protein HZS_468 [Henneguya salminicola]|nr:hypothetical protein HZS_468 [Henneguya salminicola]